MSGSDLITVGQLAERTNTGKSTWDKRRLNGNGPPYLKVGRKVLYRWTDIEHWLEGCKRRSTSDRAA